MSRVGLLATERPALRASIAAKGAQMKAAERNRRYRARQRAEHHGARTTIECDYCESIFTQRSYTQDCCSRACTEARRVNGLSYVPIDEWESKPTTRILRAMRYRGWVTVEEIGDALGLVNDRERWAYAKQIGAAWTRKSKQPKERNALSTQFRRLFADGLLERRPGLGHFFEYRLAKSVPRERLEYVIAEAA